MLVLLNPYFLNLLKITNNLLPNLPKILPNMPKNPQDKLVCVLEPQKKLLFFEI